MYLFLFRFRRHFKCRFHYMSNFVNNIHIYVDSEGLFPHLMIYFNYITPINNMVRIVHESAI